MVGNLVLHDISYQYTDSSEPLFDHFNASLSHGWTALLADNGLGKTTLAQLICGRRTPTRAKYSRVRGRSSARTANRNAFRNLRDSQSSAMTGSPNPLPCATHSASATIGVTGMTPSVAASANVCRSPVRYTPVPMYWYSTSPRIMSMSIHAGSW